MNSDAFRVQLLRASRRRTMLRLTIAGTGVRVGTIAFVNEREFMVIDPRTLRPMPTRFALVAIERIEEVQR